MSARIVFCAACLGFAVGGARALPPVWEQTAAAKVEKARAAVEQFRDRAAWSERMAKKGYLTDAQLLHERTRLADAEAKLLAAQGELGALRPEGGFFAGLARYALRARAAGAKVEAAQAQAEQAQERAAWAQRMVKMKYMSPTQAQAEQARAVEAVENLRRAAAEFDAVRPRPEKK